LGLMPVPTSDRQPDRGTAEVVEKTLAQPVTTRRSF
jgi:hypothetical protein